MFECYKHKTKSTLLLMMQINEKQSYLFEGQGLYEDVNNPNIRLETNKCVNDKRPNEAELNANWDYCHVKYVNGWFTVMPYHCSPYKHYSGMEVVLGNLRFEHRKLVNDSKEWMIAQENSYTHTMFKNDETDMKWVLYSKPHADRNAAIEYSDKKRTEKQNKGYLVSGDCWMSLDKDGKPEITKCP